MASRKGGVESGTSIQLDGAPTIVSKAPIRMEHESVTIPKELLAVVEDITAGKRRWAKVKTLLSWFGKKGRGSVVKQTIRDALTQVDLRTVPDFESAASVHTYFEFKLGEQEVGSSAERPVSAGDLAGDESSDGSRTTEPKDDSLPDVRPSDAISSAFCIGMLPAANRPDEIVTITRDHTVREAVTLMIKHDYSQLPVAQNGQTRGYMVSWRSIGRARSRKEDCKFVRDCMEKIRTVTQDAPLLDTVDRIVRNEVVLVIRHKKIVGLVTTSDLSRQYHEYAEPFLLLQEIEERLRTIIDVKLSTDDLRQAGRGDDDEGDIDDASDLTFGGYVHLLQRSDNWGKLDLTIDQKIFVKLLDDVRMIRNDVMHFRVDSSEELLDEKLEPLRQLRRLLEHGT